MGNNHNQGGKNGTTRARRPTIQGRFDLIPPGAERRLASLFERDANLFGMRDWETGTIPLSEFVNVARDAMNRLHARDTSEDWAARVAWAMMGYMHVEAAVRGGRLPIELADMPAPDPIHFLPAEVSGQVQIAGPGAQVHALSAGSGEDDTPPVPPGSGPWPGLGSGET